MKDSQTVARTFSRATRLSKHHNSDIDVFLEPAQIVLGNLRQ